MDTQAPSRLSAIEQEVESLKRSLTEAIAQVSWMVAILAAQGIEGPYVTPEIAAQCVGLGNKRIIREIQEAEYRRANGLKSDLIYGEHYFSSRDPHNPEVERDRWRVHLIKFSEVIRRPPEERIPRP